MTQKMNSLDIDEEYALDIAQQYLRSQWLKLDKYDIKLSVLRYERTLFQ